MNISFGPEKIESNDIAIVAEYTTDEGPFSDDYFILLLTHNNQTFEMSMGDPALDNVMSTLEVALGETLTLKLFNRTDFFSRILYPLRLIDRPLFIKKSVDQSEQNPGFFARFKVQPPEEWIIDPDVIVEANIRCESKKNGSG